MTTQGEMLNGVEGSAERLVEQELLDPNGDKWPQELATLVHVMERTFQRMGLPIAKATELAIAAALAIGEDRGGRMLYIPRGDRLQVALKHAQAWRRWRGNNIEEIMTFLDCSQVHAYKVLAQQRELHVGRMQPTLFNDHGEAT